MAEITVYAEGVLVNMQEIGIKPYMRQQGQSVHALALAFISLSSSRTLHKGLQSVHITAIR